MRERVATLERVANVAVLAAAIVFVIVWVQFFYGGPKQTSSEAIGAYAPGDQFPQLSGLSFNTGKPSLILFLHSGCKFCEASMPFYRQLRAAAEQGRTGFDFIVVGREPIDSLRAYLGRYGLSADATVSVPPTTALRLALTPTVLEVDSAGRVRRTWIGKLSKEAEQELFRSLSSPIAAAGL